MAGTSLGIGAWGLVTGVAMIKSGMSLPMAVFMSLVVYAGSAQLAVMPLLTVGAPLWVVWLTAACVNLRFVIFSSMWRSYFAAPAAALAAGHGLLQRRRDLCRLHEALSRAKARA